MTDPFDSLRPPRRALPAGGDDRAITRGRRVLHRRRAAYGGVVGAGLVAVGAVAVLDQGGSDRDSIRYLDPDPSSTPGASGSPGAASPTPTALPDPGSTFIDRLPPPIGASGGPAATPTAEPTPPPRGPFIGPEPTAPDGGAIVSRTTSTDRAFCATGAQQSLQPGSASDGWCTAVTGPATLVAGQRVSYSMKMCRDISAGDGTLHFATRKEVDFGGLSDGGTKQAWDPDHAATFAAAAHALTLAAGDCMTWTTTWSGQDNDGYALPAAWYEVDAWPYATEYVGNEGQTAAPIGYVAIEIRWA